MLVDFWQENFKVQVEARTGALHIHLEGSSQTQYQWRFLIDIQTINRLPRDGRYEM